MIQALELLRLMKKYISGRNDVEQCKTKPIALVVIELHLSVGISQLVISQSVSQLVSQSVSRSVSQSVSPLSQLVEYRKFKNFIATFGMG